MIAQNTDVDKSNLFSVLEELKAQDARFLTITALDKEEALDVVYHFENDSKVVNLTLRTKKDEPIESITSVYGSSFLAEYEIQELFKVMVSGLNVVFGG